VACFLVFALGGSLPYRRLSTLPADVVVLMRLLSWRHCLDAYDNIMAPLHMSSVFFKIFSKKFIEHPESRINTGFAGQKNFLYHGCIA
jgi:hypothetical protein